MTKEFNDMLYLLKCSIRCEEPVLEKETDYEKIIHIAAKQQILPVIFCHIEKAHQEGLFITDDSFIESFKNKISVSIARGIQKQEFLSRVLYKMEQENIKCVLLKGQLLADLYPYPELRLSGDVDLYVEEADEDTAIKVLKDFGFEVSRRGERENESQCSHKFIKSLELHISLYEEHCREIWFRNIEYDTKNLIKYTTKSGYTYNALEINEQLMFNVLHLIKHFLSSGVGIRQVVDCILFIEKNIEKIDREKYIQTMKNLKFDYFMDCIMEIGVKYLGAKRDNLIWTSSEHDCLSMEKILNDIEESGLFGHNDERRRGFNEAYSKAFFEKNLDGSFEEYDKKNKSQSLISKVFLRYDRMKVQYRYLENKKWLLPVAWLQRIIRFIFKRKNVDSEFSAMKENHINLMKDLKIL